MSPLCRAVGVPHLCPARSRNGVGDCSRDVRVTLATPARVCGDVTAFHGINRPSQPLHERRGPSFLRVARDTSATLLIEKVCFRRGLTVIDDSPTRVHSEAAMNAAADGMQ
jgi:hypothetical protein